MLKDVGKARKMQGNHWSSRQHYAAARTIQKYVQDKQRSLKDDDEARKLEGIGKKIGDKIAEFMKTNQVSTLTMRSKEQKEQEHIMDMFNSILGVGPVTARNWYNKGHKSIEDIKEAVKRSELKLTKNQKIGVKYFEHFTQKMNRTQMKYIGDIIRNAIKTIDKDYEVIICGSYRRGKKESKDVDILIYPTSEILEYEPDELVNKLINKLKNKIKNKIKILAKGDTSVQGVINLDNICRRFDCWVCTLEEYPFALVAWTGSGEFNIELRKHAIEKGWKLTDKCLVDKNGRKITQGEKIIKTEEDIFGVLGVEYVSPSKRN